MADNLNLSQSNTKVPTTATINDIEPNLNTIWANFEQIQSAFNALNREVAQGVDVGGQLHFTEVTFNPSTQSLIFTRQNGSGLSVSLATSPTTALISELQLSDIQSNIDEDISLAGVRELTYHVSNFARVSTLQLFIGNTLIETLNAPLDDGRQTVSYTITAQEYSDAVAASGVALPFQLRGTDTSAGSIESNTVVVNRVTDAGKVFYALSDSDNPSNIDTSTMQEHVIQAQGETFNITLGPTTAGQFIIILYPNTFPITAIRNRHFGSRDVLTSFDLDSDIRTISGQLFSARTFGPVNAGLTQEYEIQL